MALSEQAKGLIERVRELDAKATPPYWAVNPVNAQVDSFVGKAALPVCQMLWPTKVRTEEETEANAALIALYRTAAPLLADLLTQALKELEASDKALLWFAENVAWRYETQAHETLVDAAIDAARTRLSPTAKGGV